MANVTTSFSSASSLNAAYAAVYGGWSLKSAMEWTQAAYDYASYSPVSYYTSTSNSYLSGRYVSGDDFKIWGSSLLTYPSSVTRLDYTFNPEGIVVSNLGAVTYYSNGTQSGYINNITVANSSYGTISIAGYDNVAVYGDGTISSVTWNVGGGQVVATGT